ncbi:SMI1/KNR4 family protein [Actinoplanes missouriensis]|uniref:SMI1/KNR4 family protein n=1 Tax=Actinoplanes missouriensis TaxID=1866 RepID=UPI0033FA00E2
MTDGLAGALREWSGWLGRVGAPVASSLRPGRSPEEITAVLGADLPASVLTWFSWCDGVEDAPGQTIGDCWVIPGYWPVALAETRLDWSVEVPYARWVPLLRDGGADLYVAAWSAAGDEPVVVSLLDPGQPVVEFGSVAELVGVTNGCFARAVYAVDESGLLDVVDAAGYDAVYEEVTGRPAT